MRISMVSEHANPLATPGSVDAGGQNVHVAQLARSLAARGHEVTVFTRRDSADAPERVPLAPGVDVVHVYAGPAEPVPKDELLPFMPALARGIAAHWETDPPDVVHSHFWMSGLAAIDAARQLQGPGPAPAVCHTYHALGSVKRRHQGSADTSPKDRAWLEPFVGQEVDAVIATCADEVQELVRLGLPTAKIHVVPCGVDISEFTVEGPVEPKTAAHRIVSVGRLVPRKGVDLVIEALARLGDRGMTDVELVVAGSSGAGAEPDPEIERLRARATELGIADRVHLRGQIPREEIPALMRSADAIVCSPWYEPFGMVPLESMACGVPVIVTAVGGLTDSVVNGDTGFHVPPNDAGAIAVFLERLLPDEARKRELGANGRARAEQHYAWARVAEETERVYQRLVERPELDSEQPMEATP